MKIGDKVRFLSSIGGGKIAGFQKGNIVLVEDEDGFQIPTLASEVVVIGENADDYNMFKTENYMQKGGGTSAPHAEGRSVKAIMNDVEEDPLAQETDDYDPSLREITFQAPVQERKGGDRLSAYLAFVPVDMTRITETRFEVYLVNDSNYYMHYSLLHAENQSWALHQDGEIEPNTKQYIEEIGKTDLDEWQHIGVQLISYKRDKSFIIKAPVDVQIRVDGVKFYKLHTFKANEFFENPALIYTIIENDKPARSLVIDAKTLKQEMYADAKQTTITDGDQLNTERVDTYVRRYEQNNGKKGNPFMNRKRSEDKNQPVVVDLHADALLDTTQGMSSADILQYQLDVFHKTIEEYKKQKGTKIVFIHGKGEGVLRRAIVHELTYRYKQLKYQDASFLEYGYGATQVTI